MTDALRLREKYRIVGVLTGCLPRAPRQNVHLGLPLQLMSEELTLLLEKGKLLCLPLEKIKFFASLLPIQN